MDTRIDEIEDRIYRISTYTAEGPPGGITFNQFLIDAEEPLLVHTGMRMLFPQILASAQRVVEPARLRWISSGHASRPDELGALSQWFAVAPVAQVTHGQIVCMVNVADLSDRPVRPLGDEEVLDLGGRQVQWIATPHVPGPWEAGVLVEQATGSMFCGDLFAQGGAPPVTTTDDIVGPAIEHDSLMHGTALTPTTGPTLRRLAALAPTALALMHGPTYTGEADQAMENFAAWFDQRLARATAR